MRFVYPLFLKYFFAWAVFIPHVANFIVLPLSKSECFKSSYIENYLALSYFLLFCLVGYYVYILLFGPTLPSIPYSHPDFYSKIPTISNLSFHVVSQKLVVYGVIFSTLWQLIELSKKKYVDLID